MSHHSTPHLHNKKTPGGVGADNGPSASTSTNRGPMDSNTSISDSQAANAKQLLNAYVYDFLIKSRLPQTARIFVNEAEVPSIQNSSASSNNNSPHQVSTGNTKGPSNESTPHTPSGVSQQFPKENNLPCLALAMEAPQGFLFEWWLIFWDVLQAKNNKGGSQLASQYYQSQMLKQRQQQDLQGLNMQPNMFGPANGQIQQQMQQQLKSTIDQQQIPQQFNPQQQQLDPQQQQQRYMMQMMMKQQQMSMGGNPVDPQQQQQMFGNMPPNNNLTLQQRMFITQQQQQQQSQNRMQQHAQNQMNNLRQQAVAAQHHHPQQQPVPGQHNSQDVSSHSSPSNVPRMNPQIAQAQNGVQPFQQAQQPMINGNGQAQATFGQPQAHMGIRMNSNGKPAVPGNQGDNMSIANPNPNDNGAPANRNMNALQDYQMQLMLLEKQNKKRLDIARNNGTADPNGLMALNPGVMPPQAQLQQHANSQNQNASPAAIVNSPVVNSRPSPTANNAAAVAKRKKDPPAKRGRKPSATSVPTNLKAANANSSAASATSNNPPNNSNNGPVFKKEYSAPLTPASESANDAVSKRKRRNTSTTESPNKQSVTKNIASKEKPIPEEPSKDKKNDDILPAASSSFQDQPNDQIFPVEILGGNNNNDNHLFGAPMNNGGLDDIDFDFNQFLDGSGDNSLNDGMNGFNWGSVDAIENGD